MQATPISLRIKDCSHISKAGRQVQTMSIFGLVGSHNNKFTGSMSLLSSNNNFKKCGSPEALNNNISFLMWCKSKLGETGMLHPETHRETRMLHPQTHGETGMLHP